MLKNVLSMVKEVIEKGNTQALQELNDIFEENEVDKLNINICKTNYLDMDNDEVVEISYIPINSFIEDDLYNIYGDVDRFINLDNLDEEWFALFYNLETCDADEIAEYLVRLNLCLDMAKKYNVPMKKIQTPADWGFLENDMNVPNFVETFTKQCILPPEQWWTNNE